MRETCGSGYKMTLTGWGVRLFTLPLLTLVAASAFADEPTPTGGTLKFSGHSFIVRDIYNNERTYAAGETLTPTSQPALFYLKPVLNEGEHLWGISAGDALPNDSKLFYRVPRLDGWVPFSPFPSPASNMTVKAQIASEVIYVDPVNGNNDYDGTAAVHEQGTDHGPKETLQAANDAATQSFALVLAAPGIYSNGVTTVEAIDDKTGVTYYCKRRLSTGKIIAFRSTAGAEQTIIMGAPDPDTLNDSSKIGRGPNAVSGVRMSSSGSQLLQGFTITGCYSPYGETKNIQNGVAFSTGSYRTSVHDCIMTNNVGYQGVTTYGNCLRCKIVDNRTYQYAVGPYGRIYSCLIASNSIEVADAAQAARATARECLMFSCTLDLRSRLNPNGRLQCCQGSTAYNSIIFGYRGSETACFVNSLAYGEMLLADPLAGDYRLSALSPAVNYMQYEDVSHVIRRGCNIDVYGNPCPVRNGKYSLGAVQNDPLVPCVVRDGVTSLSSSITNVVLGSSFTVTATDPHPFFGFTVNGEKQSTDSRSIVLQMADYIGSAAVVKALYDTNWYIDCASGSDDWAGSAANPKATIRAATTNAVSGDVIHVAPGTYGAAEGAKKHNSSATVLSRVIIPAGVTVESTEGAEKTFIVGAPAAAGDANDQGNGPGAVRCVYAGDGATLRGFTVTGGHTATNTAKGLLDNYGGALVTGGTQANVEDCIISNNYSHCAMLYKYAARRCRILGNFGGRVNPSGSAGLYCWYYSCIVAGNKGHAPLYYHNLLESCTIGKNTEHDDSAPQTLYNPKGPILNSLFLYDKDRFQGTAYATNSIFCRTETTGLSAANCSNCLFGVSAADVRVDSDYKPLSDNIAIDAGDNSLATFDIASETDVYGTPRALNGRIDIGAVEYDWRPTFSQLLGKGFSVEYASPSVTTNASGGLLVQSGAVAGKFGGPGPYELSFSLTGGTLEAFVGGERAGVYSGAGEQTMTLEIPDTTTEFRFVFTPDEETPGVALLKKIASSRGLMITFR